ncbi:F-box only protein 36-like [Strongylocentrotus purpuratus]|uniref:F-box domain-containing protein n=1 Tax=Strongylocentrotus purpuratus TaxID=7668 RepID=A0A7M7G3S9_STRPU|nr:F-box only protein 36-like [Strongylocentrotus purpuratus]|eukprot:XP_001187528.1 PREDICTED: F-box only protein 36-like [Strongylocentrotus purpuratus]
MASLLPKDGVLLDITGQAPAPSKNFNEFKITTSEVIWRTWVITLRNDAKRLSPGATVEPLEDFQYDDRMQFDVGNVFGQGTLDYATLLSQGVFDYIMRVPQPLMLYMLSFLELEDIARMSQTCKAFYELCGAEALWEQIYETHCGTTVTDEMKSLAEEMGWKKMFFTNKLQLQVKLRRHTQRIKSPDPSAAGRAFLTEDD